MAVPTSGGSVGPDSRAETAEGRKLADILREDEVQAQKLETVGRLTSGVAHDFANILTLISGYSEIALNRMGPEDPLRPELEEIRRAANRGAAMTSQLLDFVRSQAAESQVLDLNAVVAETATLLRPIIGEHIELETHLRPNLGRVQADSAQITRMVMNLVLNARDAMPGGGRIVIDTSETDLDLPSAAARELKPGRYVTVALADTGTGIDDHAMAHLFQPFFTTKNRGRGAGLGLSTVYSIVKQCQGDIQVITEQGQGTTFTVFLPKVELERAPAVNPAVTAYPAQGSETILLAEDEDGVRRLLKHILISQGYTVLEASDGADALELYTQHRGPVHLLLTDVVMPRMSGRELAERLLKRQPGLKVLYISGYTDETFFSSGAPAGQRAFLQKPIKPEVLARRIREILGASSVSGASGS